MEINCNCGNEAGYLQRKNTHVGVYCTVCKKWYKWLGKKDVQTCNQHIFNEGEIVDIQRLNNIIEVGEPVTVAVGVEKPAFYANTPACQGAQTIQVVETVATGVETVGMADDCIRHIKSKLLDGAYLNDDGISLDVEYDEVKKVFRVNLQRNGRTLPLQAISFDFCPRCGRQLKVEGEDRDF